MNIDKRKLMQEQLLWYKEILIFCESMESYVNLTVGNFVATRDKTISQILKTLESTSSFIYLEKSF